MKLTFFTTMLLISSFCIRAQSLYFPPLTGNTWDTVSPASLGWCTDKLDTLINYVGRTNARAFIILKDGKIVVEKYYGSFTKDSSWYWASAAKSLTSFLIGMAQEGGYLNINDSLPKYLGQGFSSETPAQERAIRIRHQLTMTTGINEMYGGVTTENHCTADSCLTYLAQPGSRWAYHNAPYTLTHWVIDSATHMSTNSFKSQVLQSITGITGSFFKLGYDDLYISKPRSFARFGLLMLAKGNWNGTPVMHDTAYFNAMINTSQPLNPAYGYLWWLNGKSSYRLPGVQTLLSGMLEAHAPADMYAALGKDDQILNVVPSKGIVLVRMGEPMYSTIEVPNFSNDSIWVRLNAVFCNNPTSANVLSATAPLRVYPNPAGNILFVENAPAGFRADVVNTIGAIVLSASGTKAIDIAALAPGLYQLRISSGGSVRRAQFVKQ